MAQPTYRVVFDVSVAGEQAWDGILKNIENLRKALGAKSVEVVAVAHGKALPFLLKTNTNQEEQIRAIVESGGVRFVACENTMRRDKVTKDQLFIFVGTTDSGMAELVRKQTDGWSYIKGGG